MEKRVAVLVVYLFAIRPGPHTLLTFCAALEYLLQGFLLYDSLEDWPMPRRQEEQKS